MERYLQNLPGLVGTLCVMHRCVKKHQNVRIRDPSVPRFSYVGIRGPSIPNNIRKKTLIRIKEPSIRGWTCDGQKPSNPTFLSYFQIKEPSILFCSGVSNSNSKSENPRFQLFYGIHVMSPRNLLGSVGPTC